MVTMNDDIDFEPTADDLAAVEDDLDVLADDELEELLSGIEDDDYEPEPWESLDALADNERDAFDPWAASGLAWDDVE